MDEASRRDTKVTCRHGPVVPNRAEWLPFTVDFLLFDNIYTRQANCRILRWPVLFATFPDQSWKPGWLLGEEDWFGTAESGVNIHPMTSNRVSYTLDSTLASVNRAEETASRIASTAGFEEDEVMRIAMAVREATVNAVLHGNAYDESKKVTVEFEKTPRSLVIVITDQGRGIDLNSIPDPLAPENLLKTSGRGIFLIRSFMDEVQINPSQAGTEIKMIKHVPGQAADRKEASQ